jgi:hypothetical protein
LAIAAQEARPESATGSRQAELWGLALDGRRCYVITLFERALAIGEPMPTHVHPHHHHPGEGHPPASISPSILRMSVLERLAVAGALIVVLWGAVLWAMKV